VSADLVLIRPKTMRREVLEYIVECIKVRPVAANDHHSQELALEALDVLGFG
jgi:hypothetical protein